MTLLDQGVKVSSLDEAVLKEVREVLRISDDSLLRQRQNQILRAVRFDNMEDRFAGVSNANERTFGWMFDERDTIPDPATDGVSDQDQGKEEADGKNHQLRLKARDNFVHWLETPSTSPQDAVFHILGKPGAGKSTLMKYLSTHEKSRSYLRKWSKDKELVTGSFFFWKPGSDPQKSHRGLVRALLYSILSEARDLIPIVFPAHWLDTQSCNNSVFLEQHEIEGAFNTIIKQPRTYDRYRFGFFIDGLDEFEDKLHYKTKQQLVSLIFDWIRDSNNHIKIIVSSRQLVEFVKGFGKSPGIRLQDLTRSDIETVVTRRLAKVQEFEDSTDVDSSTLRNIKNTILEKANGVFLWVTLVLNSVEAGITQGDSWFALERKIDTLPTELKDLLQRIVDDINPSDRIKAVQIFEAIRRVTRHNDQYPLWMYLFWDDVVLDPDYVSKQSLTRETQKQIDIRLSRARNQIYGLSRGLLEIVSAREIMVIDFTHRSVVEFLNQLTSQKRNQETAEGFDIAHTFRQCALGYVKMIGVPDEHELVVGLSTIINEYHWYPPHYARQRQHQLLRPDAQLLCDYIDQLMKYIDMQHRGQSAFPNTEHITGEKVTSSLSPAAQSALKTITASCLHEYVSRHKRKFAANVDLPKKYAILGRV